ncbi:DUF423 domain-containing protein [Flavobacterium sp. NRK1]|jgi:uncharacterized membrane protein YgdD (TMEM256/DUF423 family)|uniref:DUF423 domain-containing protein n=1 Tax=Flavobacterium sp. NRK1 TaxID=2954929 RepID=UPI0020938C77|nr:DUF423 domain-containing protein [Flavobacterium sp. NRK1]MCO6148004.1 DUF423 domain-containing protein [Flavobacterium sp. NRK1]
MNRKIIAIAAVLGAVAIVLGAFGAHGLKNLISVESLSVFETGVKYQMYHALFLLFLGSTSLVSDKVKNIILKLVVAGVVFFSGSVYFLACNVLFSFDFKKIGIITPIGGLLLIAAWVTLFLHLIKQKR